MKTKNEVKAEKIKIILQQLMCAIHDYENRIGKLPAGIFMGNDLVETIKGCYPVESHNTSPPFVTLAGIKIYYAPDGVIGVAHFVHEGGINDEKS